MKILFVILALLSTAILVKSQTVIFLHHSTGGKVYYDGNVSDYINDYNIKNGSDIQIIERSYPDSPYPWENYPYDYWNLWINSQCDNSASGIECLENLTASYDIIIWKHCFPGAEIIEGSQEGIISSSSKTLANYKLQYRALRDKMDSFPNNQFIVWTLVPLHRLATNQEEATRAAEFVSWVKNQWLNEDMKSHPNIHIFDYFGLTAQREENPAYGFQYCLKYEYEKSHEGSDSHPNTLACETVAPLFAQFIVGVATNDYSTGHIINDLFNEELQLFPNPTTGLISIKGNFSTNEQAFIYNLFGQQLLKLENNSNEFDISSFTRGVYLFKIGTDVIKVVKE